MATMLILLGLGYFLVLVLSPRLATAECPDKTAISNLDLERFSGLWNVLKESDIKQMRVSKNINCKHAIFSIQGPDAGSDMQVTIVNYNSTSRTHEETRLGMRKMKTNQQDGKFELLVREKHDLLAHYFVLGTDYDNYAVVWVCFIGYDDVDNLQYYSVLSRKKSLGEPHWTEASKLLPRGAYRKIDQTICPQYTSTRP